MNMSGMKRWGLAAVVLFACGCSKLTYDNWQTIQVGAASPEEVKARLGDPWKTVDQTWIYNDADRGVTAMIKFADDRVIRKEWADAKRGMETIGAQPDEPGESEQIQIRRVK